MIETKTPHIKMEMAIKEHKIPAPEKVRDQSLQQRDLSNLDRGHSNVTNVVVGGMDLEIVQVRGA